MTQTCMCWGIETGDGWFDLIWKLCENLEKFKGLTFSQVKEKFGGLRVYFNFKSKYRTIKKHRLFLQGLNSRTKRKIKREYKTIDYLIDEAMRKSYKTCESCGNEANSKTKDYWDSTLCQNCRVR